MKKAIFGHLLVLFFAFGLPSAHGGVIDGTPVNAVTTNAAFMDKNTAKTFTIAIADIQGGIETKSAVDSVSTGSLQNVTLVAPITIYTNASLSSIQNITLTNKQDASFITVRNNTGGGLTLKNLSGGTSSLQINTGIGADLILPSAASASMYYDTVNSKWQVVSMAGSDVNATNIVSGILSPTHGGTGTATNGTNGDIPYSNNSGVFQYSSQLEYTTPGGLYVGSTGTIALAVNSTVASSLAFELNGTVLGYYATVANTNDWTPGTISNDLVFRMPNTGNALSFSFDGGNNTDIKMSASGLVSGTNAAVNGAIGIANGGGSGATATIQNLGTTSAYNFNLPVSAGTSGQPMLSGGGVSSSMTFGTLSIGAGGTGQTSATAAILALLPTQNSGNAGYPYVSGGSGSASWSLLSVAGGGTGDATLTNHGVLVGAGTTSITGLAAASAGTFLTGQGTGADPAFSATPTLGVNATTSGVLNFATSVSSGQSVSIQNLGALTAYNFNLPITVGSPGQFLTSQGGGSTSMTWSSGSGARTPTKTIFSSTGTTTGELFTVSSANATVGATYTNNTQTFTVLATIASGTQLYTSQTGNPTSTGTLTKATGTGDATITFSAALAMATYTTASGSNLLKITAIGGGGGGGGTASTTAQSGAGGGGGGGSTGVLYISSPAASYYYIVGVGGSGGSAGNNPGANGGTTIWNLGSMAALGGSAGGGSGTVTTTTVGGGGGGGGTVSGSSIPYTGQNGFPGLIFGVLGLISGVGGGAGLGQGAGGAPIVSSSSTGTGGASYGGGGAGGGSLNNGGTKGGGNGASGGLIIEEY